MDLPKKITVRNIFSDFRYQKMSITLFVYLGDIETNLKMISTTFPAKICISRLL